MEPGRQRNQGSCLRSNFKHRREEKLTLGLGQWPCQIENEGKYRGDNPEPSTGMVGPWSRLATADADWATRIFREHNKEYDLWAAKGVKGREDEWVDTAQVVWS